MARNLAPTVKVRTGTTAGAAAIVLVWVAGLAGLDVPPEVAAAVAVLLNSCAAWLIPEPPPKE